LRYADEVRRAQTYFTEIGTSKPEVELLDLAKTLIDKKSSPFKPDVFHDRYLDALTKLIDKKSKAKGKRILEDVDEPETKGKSNVIDLMAALKKSVGSTAGAKKSAVKKAPASKKKPAPAKRKSA